ncbi:MAG: adenylyltransferase/cytidyltransferase family protein [Patescibacteria group bacterium]|nr:adenylyltransferase/cytidyltransferase family protein [Patescibacteria group bacterium]
MKKIMVFGTFDIFHPGHKNFFEQARTYGDCLIVVIARDKTVLEVKGVLPKNNENVRLKMVRESNLVDRAVLGSLGDKYEIIKEKKPDVICLGYDQRFFTDKLEEKLEEFDLEDTVIVKMRSYHPEIYKSSKYIKR